MDYFIVGYPMLAPRSPVIWNDYFIKNKMTQRMFSKELIPSELKSFIINKKKKKDFKAMVITMPYKKKLNLLCDDFDESAEMTGSVNLIINRSKKLIGFNTDIIGFEKSLNRKKFFIQNFDKIIIYGYGGTGEAISKYISKKYGKEIYVISSKENLNFNSISFESDIGNNLLNFLIINCTPLGSQLSNDKGINSPFSFDFLKKFKNSCIFDINYKISKKNNLERDCLSLDLEYLNGLMMNRIQAEEAIRLTFEN